MNWTLVSLVALDLLLVAGLGVWAARGGAGRIAVGLLLSAVFGLLFGVPIYALTVLLTRVVDRRGGSSTA